jgi:hypothetical protein
MIILSRISDAEAFKIGVDFWRLVALCGKQERRNPDETALKFIYGPRFSDIHRIHISRIVYLMDIVRVDNVQKERNTLTQVQYRTMKETLVILTSVDSDDTIVAIRKHLDQFHTS